MVAHRGDQGSERTNANRLAPTKGSKLGVALSTLGMRPINGLRHAPTDETNGWYLWCGTTLSEDADFFAPIHIEHVDHYLPEVIPYLDLPAGSRFLLDGTNVQDVWFDETLLVVE